LWRREKSLAPAGNQTPVPRPSSHLGGGGIYVGRKKRERRAKAQNENMKIRKKRTI
jgi:hypothetical protein